MTEASQAIRPGRALLHPLWWTALLTMALNDHLLKGSGLPAGLTGKLSDFAGLLVAPLVLAVFMRVGTRRGWALTHLAVGLGFALINVCPPFAAWFESVAALTPFPWAITVDPSDLVALAVLPISHALFVGSGREHIAMQRGGLILGFFACAATSPPPEERFPAETGSFSIGNDTDIPRIVRIRRVKPEVFVDCEAVLIEPGRSLSDAMFGDAEVWSIESGRAIPLRENSERSCTLLRVESEGLPAMIVAWRNAEYPQTILQTDLDGDPARTIRIAEPMPGALVIDHSVVSRQRPPNRASLGCELPPASEGLEWSPILAINSEELLELRESPDGCTTLEFASGQQVVCSPVVLPFSAGELLDVAQTSGGGVESFRISSETHALEFLNGAVSVENDGVALEVTSLPGCEVQFDECGGAVLPASVGEFLAGDSWVDGNGRTTHLVRALTRVTGDSECSAHADSSNYVELVRVEGE